MKLLNKGIALLCLSLVPLLASACALSPAQAPASDLFTQMTPIGDVDMPAPAALPDRPHAAALVVNGAELLAFDAAGAQRLIVRDQVGEANTQIAQECSAGFNTLSASYDHLLAQAKDHERVYNRLGERWAEAENDLQRQRVVHGAEAWLNHLLLLAAIGLAL